MDITQFFQYFLDNLNYFYVTFLMTIESTVIPFPSEVVVAPAGYMAADGKMNIFLVIFFATLGADLGAAINYWVSYFVGRPIVYKFANSKFGHLCLINEEKVKRSEDYFDKHGNIATLIGRMLPVIRQLISVPAGLAKMNFGYFILYTTIGAGIWNCVLAGLGWYLHSLYNYEMFKEQLSLYNRYINLGVIAIFLLVVGFLSYKHYKRRLAKQ